ncbi:putative gp76-like protein [Esparto virus]|uniref:Putative gp76-like protein n=1 Tax=Esparto virus TaxID=2072209 RepID=A0A2I7G2U6_9VIRU|nr:putative gp76-like protein [Esparto virus]AUQ43958.1 putative gp76-like protein [Esparto virus]
MSNCDIMFSPRQTIATNDELSRQYLVEQILLFDERPTTYIGKKAAAIYGCNNVSTILKYKIYNALDKIQEYAKNINDFSNESVRRRIYDLLDTIHIDYGITIQLPQKPPILYTQPILPPVFTTTLRTATSTMVNIAEFEHMVFENKAQFRYLNNTSFATYMYQNILQMLNVSNIDTLEGVEMWQAKYAILLNRTNFNDYVARNAFYYDQVNFLGVGYDTSFVPKYDVNSLKVQDSIPATITDQSQIDYYYKLDVRKEQFIPKDKIGIFLTFPFKDGHYIKPSGKIRFLNMRPLADCTLKSTGLIIKNICGMNDIEAAIDNAARSVKLNDLIYRTVYSKNLKEQAVTLMIIRRIVGEYGRFGKYLVQLPNEFSILSWTKLSCSRIPVILPPIYTSTDTNVYVALVQDISQSCYSKLGASMLCSGFGIPEMNMAGVYQLLTNDAEKYVFYTLVLQVYPNPMYFTARSQLEPNFGQSNINLNKYPVYRRYFTNNTTLERVDMQSQPLVDDSSNNNLSGNKCTPYSCSEMYEFNDRQLNTLVATGDVELNDLQYAHFIASLLDL